MSHDKLTPPEQTRRNLQILKNFGLRVSEVLFHPKRLWLQLVTWQVVSNLVLLFIAMGLGVLSMSPPVFRLARFCFVIASLILAIKVIHWLLTADTSWLERLLLALIIFGMTGWLLVESLRWVNQLSNRVVQNVEHGPVLKIESFDFHPSSNLIRPGKPLTVNLGFSNTGREEARELRAFWRFSLLPIGEDQREALVKKIYADRNRYYESEEGSHPATGLATAPVVLGGSSYWFSASLQPAPSREDLDDMINSKRELVFAALIESNNTKPFLFCTYFFWVDHHWHVC